MIYSNMLFCCFVALTIATIPSTNKKLTHLSACTKGRITHYTEYESGGSCGLGEVSSKVTEGYMFTAALNEAFLGGAEKCGVCYEMVGGDGAIRIMANNRCPVSGNEKWCSGDMYHFDLASNAAPYLYSSDTGSTNGNVTFRMVACDLDGNIKIKTRDSNDYYYSFIVMNHVIGLKSAFYSYDDGETFTQIERETYNAFNMHGPGGSGEIPTPFKIKIVSIADEEFVIDINSIAKGTILDSGIQFTVPDDKFFDVETHETTTKPDDIDECCDQPDDIAIVYDDDVEGVWIAQGWDNVNTLDCTDSPYKGSYCLKTVLNQWGGLQFYGNHAVKTDLYSNLTFYIRSDTACDNCLLIATSLGKTYISISEANTWQYVNIPMEELGTDGYFNALNLQNVVEDRTYYFDEVKWIHSDADSTICADKYLSKGIGITIISVLMIFIILI